MAKYRLLTPNYASVVFDQGMHGYQFCVIVEGILWRDMAFKTRQNAIWLLKYVVLTT